MAYTEMYPLFNLAAVFFPLKLLQKFLQIVTNGSLCVGIFFFDLFIDLNLYTVYSAEMVETFRMSGYKRPMLVDRAFACVK